MIKRIKSHQVLQNNRLNIMLRYVPFITMDKSICFKHWDFIVKALSQPVVCSKKKGRSSTISLCDKKKYLKKIWYKISLWRGARKEVLWSDYKEMLFAWHFVWHLVWSSPNLDCKLLITPMISLHPLFSHGPILQR